MEIVSILAILFIGVVTAVKGSDDITIRMPGVKPSKPDTYLCTGHKLPNKPTNGRFYSLSRDIDVIVARLRGQ